MSGGTGSVKDLVQNKINENKLLVTSKSWCPMCREAKQLLDQLNASYTAWDIDILAEESQIQDEFQSISGARTVPRITIDGDTIGGCDELMQMYQSGKLLPLLKEKNLIKE